MDVSYRITIQRTAAKTLGRIEHRQRARLEDAISALGRDPRPHGCRKLNGAEGWRVRVGGYRIVYIVDDPGDSIPWNHTEHRSIP